jgi:hypothetical protein
MFRNISLMVLLVVEEEKRAIYGNLRRRIETVGENRQKAALELAEVVVELLYSGLLLSSTVSIRTGTSNLCRIVDSDELQININYDFIEEEKRRRGNNSNNPPLRPYRIIKGNILALPV